MGGGKSYYGAELVYSCLSEGGYVMTNLDLNMEEVERLGWTERVVLLEGNPAEWRSKLIAGVEGSENCVVVDEAAMLFYVHDASKNRDANRPFYELMVWSRKLGLDMYMIAQHADNVDPAIRRAAQYIIHCVNVRKIPFLGATLQKFCGDFRRLWITPLSLKAVRSTYHRFRPEIGKFYATEKTAGFQVALEQKATRKKPEESGWKPVLSFAFLMLAMVGGGLWVARHQWNKARGPKKETAIVQAVEAPPVSNVETKKVESAKVETETTENKRGGGMLLVEWDVENEFPISSAWRSSLGWVVATPAERYEVGRIVQGKLCVSIIKHQGTFFMELDGGEFHVARPMTRGERVELWKPSPSPNSSRPSLPDSSPPERSSLLGAFSPKLAKS